MSKKAQLIKLTQIALFLCLILIVGINAVGQTLNEGKTTNSIGIPVVSSSYTIIKSVEVTSIERFIFSNVSADIKNGNLTITAKTDKDFLTKLQTIYGSEKIDSKNCDEVKTYLDSSQLTKCSIDEKDMKQTCVELTCDEIKELLAPYISPKTEIKKDGNKVSDVDWTKDLAISTKAEAGEYKIGVNSIVVITMDVAVGNGILTNVTAENNFTHLSLNDSSLVLYMPFDAESSVYQTNRWVAGKMGNGLSFDGSTQYATIGRPAQLDSLATTTWCAWVKRTTDSGQWEQVMQEAVDSSGAKSNFRIAIASTDVASVGMAVAGTQKGVTGTTAITTGNWFYICGDYNGTKVNLYVNGVSEGTPESATGTISTMVYPFYLGRNLISGIMYYNFNGVLDEVKIWNSTRSPTEILNIYGNESTGVYDPNMNTANLVVNLPLNETSNAGFQDISSSGLNGSIMPSITKFYDYSSNNFDGTVVGSAFTTRGEYGQGVGMDGATDSLNIADNNALDITGALTISFWMKVSAYPSAGTQGLIFEKWCNWGVTGCGAGYPYVVRLSETGTIAFLEYNGGSVSVVTSSVIPKDTWVHFTAMRNSTSMVTYINGAYDKIALSGGYGTANANPLWIGSRGGGANTFYRGNLDEVMIYNRALSSTEISAIYNNQSARFYPAGTQDIRNINLSTNGNENFVNVSLQSCQTLLNTKLSAQIGMNSGTGYTYNGSIVNFTSCVANNLSMDTGATNVSLRIGFITDSNYFYTPLVIQNITLESWNTTGETPPTDTTSPYFTTIPTNATLTYGEDWAGVYFNATDETEFGTYYLGNWTDYFEINSTGFLINTTSLSAGEYIINVSINDSSGNVNMTWYNLTINKYSTALGISGTTPIAYGTLTDVAGNSCPAELYCSLDIANNIYGVGVSPVTFNYSTSGNTNYTANWTIIEITINQATPSGSLAGTTPITYGTAGDVYGTAGSSGDGGCTYELFREDISVSDPDTDVLGAGVYDYILNTTGCENYTSSASLDTFSLTVNQNGEVMYVLFNETSPISEGNVFTVWSNATSGFILYRNGTVIINNSIQDLVAGAYNFTVVRNDTTNYSSIYDEEIFVIEPPADTTPPEYSNEQLSIANYSSYDFNAVYQFNMTWIDVLSSVDTVLFEWNGVNYTTDKNGDVYNFTLTSLGAGYYNYTWWANDTEGNLNTTGMISYAVGLGTQTMDITWTNFITYGTLSDAFGFETSDGDADVVYGFFRSVADTGVWVPVSNPDIRLLAVGAYDYKYNFTAGENYSAGSFVKGSLNVINNTGNCNVSFNTTSPLAYPNQFKVWSNCNSDFVLYRNGTIISNYSEQNLGVGYYNFTVIRTDQQNYTNIYDEENFLINKGNGIIYTYLNNSRSNITIEQYTSIWLNGTLEIGVGNISLYINNSLNQTGTSPLSILYNFTELGLFNITTFYSGNENYTSAFETWWITANDIITPNVTIYSPLDGSSYSFETINILLNLTSSDESPLGNGTWSIDNGTTNTSFELDVNGSYADYLFWNQPADTTQNWILTVCIPDVYDNLNCTDIEFTIYIIPTSLQEPGAGGGWDISEDEDEEEIEEEVVITDAEFFYDIGVRFIKTAYRESVNLYYFLINKISPRNPLLGMAILWLLLILLIFHRVVIRKIRQIKLREDSNEKK